MSEPGFFLRKATAADLPAIVAIEHESFVDPWNEETFLQALECWAETFFVAVVDREVAGFIVGGIEDTGEAVYGHICNFAVAERFRHRGIGRALVRSAEQQFAIALAEGVQLEVRYSNTAAQRFYRRRGYEPVFTVAGYYSNGEDAIVMMKWFF
ncbi:ribosomal protein S18-alanine N-acetyltransferase [Methanofollis sp. UBA420]|jgi:ribosomal-protein-alanine N-acetyltransferase|uniref:ribosomal protein S18-alanine N-acetyltransferase n=1 Tax=Methanofollis sp. UBA420 TaxID=1915514 RepID=UPI00316AD9E0